MFGQVILIFLKLLGAMGLFLFGMQLSSEGLQRAAGDKLQRTVNFMTKNRFVSVFTGILVTILIQSSSATSVMVVSFVNAGLLSLMQAIGVLMGANIGTTLTGWVIAAVGIQKFSMAFIALPLFGLGFFMTFAKNKRVNLGGYGEGMMGFALIFLGLEYLAKAVPNPGADALAFLGSFSDSGFVGILLCVLAGTLFTMLVSASSATQAITITMAVKGLISYEMAAALTLGANIGTTFNSFLVSIRASVGAKRAALAHILFNCFGAIWVLFVFKPFVQLVDFITPGAVSVTTIGAHLAMFHTLFNAINTVVLLPLMALYARVLNLMIPDKVGPEGREKAYVPKALVPITELNLVQARIDIVQLAGLAQEMYERFMRNLTNPPKDMAKELEAFAAAELYADSMLEGLSRFLLEIAEQDLGDRTRENIGIMLRVVTDLENITDSCYNLGLLLDRSAKKKGLFDKEELKNLEPYTALVREFLDFVGKNVDKPMSGSGLAQALKFEQSVDASRLDLKRLARRRLKAGAEVRSELIFIDLVRHVEKIGDFAFSISESLRDLR